MSALTPVVLQDAHVALEPLAPDHAPALEAAAADGKLWQLWFHRAPAPGEAAAYIAKALDGQKAGLMLPFVVLEKSSGDIVGTTRYYDYVNDPRIIVISLPSLLLLR